jgi:hypothetical protein
MEAGQAREALEGWKNEMGFMKEGGVDVVGERKKYLVSFFFYLPSPPISRSPALALMLSPFSCSRALLLSPALLLSCSPTLPLSNLPLPCPPTHSLSLSHSPALFSYSLSPALPLPCPPTLSALLPSLLLPSPALSHSLPLPPPNPIQQTEAKECYAAIAKFPGGLEMLGAELRDLELEANLVTDIKALNYLTLKATVG